MRRIMGQLFLTVEDAFIISGRGLVIIGPIGTARSRVGGQIELRRPDGSVITTRIASLEMINVHPEKTKGRTWIGISLPREIAKDDVPPGTEVWAIGDERG